MTEATKNITITLDTNMDISAAEKFLQEVREAFPVHDTVIFDASAVERLTTPAVQIMLSAFAQADSEGKSCHVSSPSESMMNTFSHFGLAEQIQQRVQ